MKKKGLSESTMMRLWREKVLRVHNGRCFFCGARADRTPVDCHHIVKRKHLILRYDHRNGIPACRTIHPINQHLKMSCHEYAETPQGKALIAAHVDNEYLTARVIPAKQFFAEQGITEKEYMEKLKQENKS